jgi:hypothetical protein
VIDIRSMSYQDDYMNKDAVITVRITMEVREALHQAAADDMRTLASLVNKVLTEYVRDGGYLKAKPARASSPRKER